ncbi:MAG: hypothetical protein PHQ23_12740, partial [Candidatus Wallbacteria bacterium]|nr:hypothetical protein [Candidatus Wallbacteria bacterium]
MTKPPVREDSLPRRYLFKLVTNIISSLARFAHVFFVPRALGPAGYGSFNFLVNFFTQIASFLEAGSSIAFFTKLSSGRSEKRIIPVYFRFAVLLFSTLLLFTAAARLTGMNRFLWPGESMPAVLLGLIMAFSVWLIQVLFKLTDAVALTVPAEKIRMAIRVGAAFLIAGCFFAGLLTLTSYFILETTVGLLIVLALTVLCLQKGVFRGNDLMKRIPAPLFSRYSSFFFEYCSPLFVYNTITILLALADTWLLQQFGGRAEQGYYGLSYQISTVCFFFSGAMTPLLIRETAKAHASGDKARIRKLFLLSIPSLYAVAAALSMFVAVQPEKFLYFLGGKEFSHALPAVIIMALYPIHQTFGQLNGALYYATGRTALYRNIGIAAALAGLPLSWFLLTPPRAWGLDLGATGLALKVVIVQFIAVNTLLFFNTRFLGIPFAGMFFRQTLAPAAFGLSALASSAIMSRLLPFNLHPLLNLLLCGLLHTGTVA